MTSLTSSVLKGSALSLLIKFIQKSLGLISTLILARLLVPEDFGIVAISALVLHFCEVLSTAGSESYLIHKASLSDDDINSSWTLEVILKLSLWLLLVLSIPFISSFYEKDELQGAILLSSFVLFFNAFRSPGIALLKRDIDYKKIFTLSIIQKFSSFAIVLLLAFYSPSYWAIIVGDVVSIVVFVIGSYVIHPYRPRWCTTKISEQLSFSKWIILKSGVGYARAQMDVFFIGKLFSAKELGEYHLARSLSVMPSTDIIGPAIEPLLASFSRVKHDFNQLNQQFYICFFIIISIITPISVYMWNYPETIVDVLLGSQWQNVYPLLSVLSLLLFSFSVGQLINPFCVALGQVKAIFIYDVVSFIFTFACLLFFLDATLLEFALLRGLLAFVPLAGMLLFVKYYSNLSITRLINLLAPIITCSLLANLCVGTFYQVNVENAFFSLLITTGFFFAAYLFLIYIVFKLYYKKYKEWQKVNDILKSIALRLNVMSR